MVDKVVRKTTKKRVRKADDAVPVVVARKTAVAGRKAPLREAGTMSSEKRSKPKMLFAGIGVFLMLLCVSALIGYSDKGQLDVSSVITQRKQSATPEEQEALNTVPVQQARENVPNGGLVGMGKSEPSQSTVPPVLSTTTPDTATSTDTTAEETTIEQEDVQASTTQESVQGTIQE